MSTMNHHNKLKLHDSFIIDMDEMTWHGVRSRRPQMELSECETDELVSNGSRSIARKVDSGQWLVASGAGASQLLEKWTVTSGQ